MTSAIQPLGVRFFASPPVHKALNNAAVISLVLAIFVLCWPFIPMFLITLGLLEWPEWASMVGVGITMCWWTLTIPCVVYGHKAKRLNRTHQGCVRSSVMSFIALLTGYTFIVLVITGFLFVMLLEAGVIHVP